MLYNLFFTSLPPLVIGVYDKMVSEDLLLASPYLYRYVSAQSFVLFSRILTYFSFSLTQSRLGLAYRPHSFWIIMLDSLYQSLVIFFIAESAYWDSTIGMWEFGTTITTSCLITMLCHGAIEIKSWVSFPFRWCRKLFWTLIIYIYTFSDNPSCSVDNL